MRWKGVANFAKELHESFRITVGHIEADVFERGHSTHNISNLIQIPCATANSYVLDEK